jgi:DHA1 family inner membrane transport protein
VRVGARGKVLGSLCLLVFLVNFGRVAFASLVEPFMSIFGVREGTAGFVATLAWLGSALPRVPTGYLLTRVRGRHWVVVGAAALVAGGGLFVALAPGVALVGAGAFLMGTASGVYFVAANPFLTELFPNRVGRVLGTHGTAAQLAAVVSPVAVGVALATAGWRALFVGAAGAAVAGAAALLLAVRGVDLPSAGAADRELVGAVRRQWPVLAFAVAMIGLTGLVWNGLFNFYVSYLTEAKGLPPSTARLLLTVMFGAGVPAMFFTGRLADRLPYVPLLFGILGGFVVCLVALTAAQGVAALAAVSAATGYVVHGIYPAIDTYLLDTLPDEHRSSAYSAYSGTMAVVGALGSVGLGTLVEAGVAYDDAFLGSAAVLAAVLAGLVALGAAGKLPSGDGERE